MARRRYELTDKEWLIIEPLLPDKPRGVPRADDRRVLNGILWRFRSGAPWAEIPERYGHLRPATTGSFAGGKLECGIDYWPRFLPGSMASC